MKQASPEITVFDQPPGVAVPAEHQSIERVMGHPDPTFETCEIPPCPNPLRNPLRFTAWMARCACGIATLVLVLAVVAAIPILNFLALGYLLNVEGRMAREGRLRSAFPLLDIAPRMGVIIFSVWIWLLPVRILASAATDAQLIDPAGAAARYLHILTIVLSAFVAVHLCLALARGGNRGSFFRPIKNVLWLLTPNRGKGPAADAAQESSRFPSRSSTHLPGPQTCGSESPILTELRLKFHFSLGVRGFLAAAAWLIIPTALFASTRRTEGGPILVTLFGGVCLIVVLCWMPFLQAHFAAENRLRAVFELKRVRSLFDRAPLAWLCAVVIVYTLSLPLYLLKVVLLPRDAMWFVTLIFIVSIWPARVVTGWAYHRATQRTNRASFLWRWIARFLIVPLVGLYVFLLFFTQFIAEHGRGALFEHHAFLLPVPF